MATVADAAVDFKYWAFISYSHQDNTSTRLDGTTDCVEWADWLYQFFQTYYFPKRIVGTVNRDGVALPERLYPVFQDKKELPTSVDLSDSIREALNSSRYLIVICSPRSAVSYYVNQEIIHFKRIGRGNRTLALIVDGEPNASWKDLVSFPPELECFPEALRHHVTAEGEIETSIRTEPIAADVRVNEHGLMKSQMGEHNSLLQREAIRVLAGVAGVELGQLVDWDAQLRLEQAANEARDKRLRSAQLQEEAERLIKELGEKGPSGDSSYTIETMVKIENLFSESLRFDDENQASRLGLRNIFRTIFDSALNSGDLNLATVYLRKLKDATPAGESGTDTAGFTAQLESAWNKSDPARNPRIKWAFVCGAAVLLVNYVWFLLAGLLIRHATTGEPDTVMLLLFNLIFALNAVFHVAILHHLIRVQSGYEESVSYAGLVNYFSAFTSVMSGNVVGMILNLVLARILTSPDIYKLAWKYQKKPKEA